MRGNIPLKFHKNIGVVRSIKLRCKSLFLLRGKMLWQNLCGSFRKLTAKDVCYYAATPSGELLAKVCRKIAGKVSRVITNFACLNIFSKISWMIIAVNFYSSVVVKS